MSDDPATLDLLDRATVGLRPDVDALVAGGVRRGRARRRTRRAAGVLAAAGTLVLGGVLLTTARPSPDAAPAGSPAGVPERAAGPGDLAATLQRLLPPGASDPEDSRSNGGASGPWVATVRYRGTFVTLTFEDQNYGVAGPAGWAESLSRAQCRKESRSTTGAARPTTCVRRGSDWIASGAAQVYADPPSRPVAGRADLWVERFTPNGYVVRLMADSRRDEQGRWAPVLTSAQLTAIVESPVWLQQR